MGKTKEEILYPLHGHCNEELEMIWDLDAAKKAMDEYAKEVAISFAKFYAGGSNAQLEKVYKSYQAHIKIKG
jgi:hypothetical protein